MMENLQIVFVDFGSTDENGSSGIDRKKNAQIKELKKLGNTKRVTYSLEGSNGFLKKLVRRLPLFPSMFAYAYSDDFDNTDVVYFRRSITDRYTVRLIKDIREHNPNCLILFEIPTYPYDKEMIEPSMYPILLKERWNRRKLHKYVDRVVLVGSLAQRVFNIPAFSIVNGIDFTRIRVRKPVNMSDGSVHAIFIGNFEYWHGLDRVIAGIKSYDSNPANTRKFVLHLVGPLKKVDTLKDTIADLVSNGSVISYGERTLDDVEDIYDTVSIGFDVFGMHRIQKGIVSSSIKSREYGAKGLPIVSESIIDYLPETSPYYLGVPEDDSPIDIAKVVAFHDTVYSKGVDLVAQEIRTFAENHCSSEAMMRPVLEYCRTELARKKGSTRDYFKNT
jgi:glycosyltransferase involved in cell wall biosynthesis